METEDQKIADEYIATLPPEVSDFIEEGVWQEKCVEIAHKYSLNPEQQNILIDTVVYIFTGIEKIDTLTEVLMCELKISQLLATQIFEELDKRVFEYGMNFITSKRSEEEKKLIYSSSTVPEIPPDILPSVAIGEFAHDVPRPVSLPLTESISVSGYENNTQKASFTTSTASTAHLPVAMESVTDEDSSYIPGATLAFGEEAISIPRYVPPAPDVVPVGHVTHTNPSPSFDKNTSHNPPANLPGIEIPQENVVKKPWQSSKIENRPTKSYSADPYRETLE